MADPSPLTGLTLALIGAGNMACAIAEGLVRAGILPGSSIRVASPSGGSASRLGVLGCISGSDNKAAAAGADIVVLCVKPWLIKTVAVELRESDGIRADATIVSIASGISISQIDGFLRTSCIDSRSTRRIVRVMPNTPCTIGAGASGMFVGPSACATDGARVRALFGALGIVEAVTELQLDAVTGLSGSGPAFVFMFIEALADGGVASGLPRPIAMRLATQLVKGSAMFLQDSGRHPGELKDAVASPAGTTIAGILKLETGGMRGTVMEAVVAAAKRCDELRKSG